MDGIDGIAAITGIVGFGLFTFFLFNTDNNKSFALLSICISFSCLGFFPFNFTKAKVFMGDVGSILLGFVFAGMVTILSKNILDFICLTSFLFPFYADELSTMVVRIKDGENLLRPHRRHFYQILANEYEVAHWKVSIGYGLAQLFVGLSVLWFRHLGDIVVIAVLVAYSCVFIALSYTVRRRLAET